MPVYSALMLVAAVPLLAAGAAIHSGKTGLIHDYHQTGVDSADRRAYGKAVAKGLFWIAASVLCSGAVALLGKSAPVVFVSVGVLLAGIAAGTARLVKAQKEFNGGI